MKYSLKKNILVRKKKTVKGPTLTVKNPTPKFKRVIASAFALYVPSLKVQLQSLAYREEANFLIDSESNVQVLEARDRQA